MIYVPSRHDLSNTYSSKINMLHSEKVIISDVKVLISGDYILKRARAQQSTIVEC